MDAACKPLEAHESTDVRIPAGRRSRASIPAEFWLDQSQRTGRNFVAPPSKRRIGRGSLGGRFELVRDVFQLGAGFRRSDFGKCQRCIPERRLVPLTVALAEGLEVPDSFF